MLSASFLLIILNKSFLFSEIDLSELLIFLRVSENSDLLPNLVWIGKIFPPMLGME